MRTKLYIIAILSVITTAADAQTYGTSYKPVQRETEVIRTQQIMQTGNAYNGTVYEPFSAATPSELGEVGSGATTEGNKPEKHIRRGFDTGGDSEAGPSPIGDGLWLLALLAFGYAGVATVRRKKC